MIRPPDQKNLFTMTNSKLPDERQKSTLKLGHFL
jgi:hypothetical protein